MKKGKGVAIAIVAIIALGGLALFFSQYLLAITGQVDFNCKDCLTIRAQQSNTRGGVEVKSMERSIYDAQECFADLPNYVYFEQNVRSYGDGTPAPSNWPQNKLASNGAVITDGAVYTYAQSIYTDTAGSQENYLAKPRQHPDCQEKVIEAVEDIGGVVVINNTVYVNETIVKVIYVCNDNRTVTSATECSNKNPLQVPVSDYVPVVEEQGFFEKIWERFLRLFQ